MRFLFFIGVLIIGSSQLMYGQPKCLQFQSILADACGSPEGKNEMFRFKVGPSNLNTANLSVTWSSNTWLGVCQNARTAQNVMSLNKTIKKCGWLLEPVSGVLPAGKDVLFITSENMDTLANSFAELEDTLFVVFQCGNASTGHFKNYQSGAGNRTTILNFSGPGGCSDTATYSADSLVDQSGNHVAADGASVAFSGGIISYFNNGCQAPGSIMDLRINTPDTTLCVVAPIGLSASSSNYKNVRWSGGTGLFLNPDTLNTTYIPSSNELYPIKLYLKAFSRCQLDSLVDSVEITKSNSSLLISSDTTVCRGNSVRLFAGGSTSYSWTSNYGQGSLSCVSCASPVAIPTQTTTYYVTSGTICPIKDSVTITVNNSLTASIQISASQTTICPGTTVVFNATASNGGSNPIYQWQVNGVNVGSNSPTFTSALLGNQDTITCLLTSNLSCVVNPLVPSNVIAIRFGNAGNNIVIQKTKDTVCAGSSATLYVRGYTGPLQWQFSLQQTGFLNIVGATDSLLNVTPSQNTYYRVFANVGNCSDTSLPERIFVSQGPTAPVLIPDDTIICAGDSTRVCVADTYASYYWNNGNTASCSYAKFAGNIWVTVTDANGCSVTSNRQKISMHPVPSVSIIRNGDTLSSFGAVNYQWYYNDEKMSGANNSIYIATKSGAYSLEITDANGCRSRSSNVVVTGIQNIGKLVGMEVYPNPTNGLINIYFPMEKQSPLILNVYNLLGETMAKIELTQSESRTYSINLSQLPKGAYLLSLMNEEAYGIQKIILQ